MAVTRESVERFSAIAWSVSEAIRVNITQRRTITLFLGAVLRKLPAGGTRSAEKKRIAHEAV